MPHNRHAAAALRGPLHLVDHVLDEVEGPVVDARQPGPEPTGKAPRFLLRPDRVGHLLPLHADGRVGQHVVELRALVAVLGEGVAMDHVAGVLAHEHHVGPAHRVGLGLELLPEDLQPRLRVHLPQVVLCHGEHAAGAAGWIEQGLDDTRPGEQRIVLNEQQADHQPDDLTRPAPPLPAAPLALPIPVSKPKAEHPWRRRAFRERP